MEAASSSYQQAVFLFSRLQYIFMTDKHNLNIISWDNQDLGSRPPEVLLSFAVALRGRGSQEPLWVLKCYLLIAWNLGMLQPCVLCSATCVLLKNNTNRGVYADGLIECLTCTETWNKSPLLHKAVVWWCTRALSALVGKDGRVASPRSS